MSGWPTVTLGDVARIQGGLQVSGSRSTKPVEVPYLRVANVLRGALNLAEIKRIRCTQAEIDRTTLETNDLLIVEGHGNPDEIGRVALWDGSIPSVVHQNHLIRARCEPAELDPVYAVQYLNSPSGRSHLLRSAKTTSGLNTISTAQVKAAPILLPPLSEQRRIAAILDHADALRAKRRKVLARLDELTQSIAVDIFGELSPDRCSLPSVRVEQAGRVQLGRQRSPKYQTGVGSRPYLRVANVHRDRFDLSDVLTMDFDESDFDTYRLQPGDILLNEGQTSELVGRPAMWRGEIEGCCFQNSLIRFTARPDKCLPEFALAVFLEYMRTGQFTKASAKTSSVAHLGAARFAAMPFPIPELALQRKYVERVEVVRTLKAQHQSALAELDALFASLRSRAFRGEL